MESFKPQIEQIKRSTLTVQEVAEYLGISPDYVYILVRENKIIHFRLGRRILFKKAAIDEWIEKNMQGGLENEY